MTDSTPLPALGLAFKPDAAEAQRRLRAYWQGEIIDRACVGVRAPKDGVDPPRRSLIVAEDFDLPGAVDEFEAWASQMFFGGESMPALMPNYGPDQWAGFLGANLALVPEQDTSWVEPLLRRLGQCAGAWTIDPANRWWRAIVDLTRIASVRCPGKFILSTIDTHSNFTASPLCAGPNGFAWTWSNGPRPCCARKAGGRAVTGRFTTRCSRPEECGSSAARPGRKCGVKEERRPSSATSAA